MVMVGPGKDCLDPTRKFPPGKHHPMSTSAALQADIRAQAGNKPFVAATRMRFAQSHDIVELQIRKHEIHQEKKI